MATIDGVVTGPLVPSLVRWGRTPDADLVYRTVLARGPSGSRELAQELGMPRRRVESALAELEAARAVRPEPGHRGTLWLASPPGRVVARLRGERLRPAGAAQQAAAQQRAVSASFAGQALELGEGVRYLPSRALTRVRLAELVAVECREHLAMNTERAFDAASARAGLPAHRQILDRGLPARTLTLPPADGDAWTPIRPPSASGRALFREATVVPMKLIVVDRRVALFPVSPDDLERGYLEVTQHPVVQALVSLFEQHWERATDPREHGIPAVTLTARERALVELLAAGHTDASAARHLRISARSVSSTLRALMDRLGVDNRFQLGLALGALHAAVPTTTPAASRATSRKAQEQ